MINLSATSCRGGDNRNNCNERTTAAYNNSLIGFRL